MKKDFLSQIVEYKRGVVARLRAQNDFTALRERALLATGRVRPTGGQHRQRAQPHRFLRAFQAPLPKIKIVAEFKRRSPSHGLIRADLSPADVAKCYETGGATAISVLTDEKYFGGSIDDLVEIRAHTQLSILRKDFVIDPIQIYEAASAGADAVLLIAAILNDHDLQSLRRIAEDQLGFDALVEVHTSNELQRAVDAGAKIIGINNRDLRTFGVSLKTSEQLIAKAPRDALLISESGLHTAEQLRHLHALGFRGFLIGETLMQAADPAAALRGLIGAADEPQPAASKL